MKFILGIAIIAVLVISARADTLSIIIPRLIEVESGGNDSAIGDGGKAVGCLQIWPIMVKDVNRISGKNFRMSDRYNRSKSIEMCKIYLVHYKGTTNIETAARMWNGGPNLSNHKKTDKYWAKIKNTFR